MAFPLDVKCMAISSVLDLYRRRYINELGLTSTDAQSAAYAMSSGELSPLTSTVFLQLTERSASKYFGLMILESLLELSKLSTMDIQEAFLHIIVYCRSKEVTTPNPYSAIQSILVPGLFYIELGNFSRVDFHIEDAEYQSKASNHLDALKLLGFVPLLDTDLKNAEVIRFCPGGALNLQMDNSVYSYKLNSQKPSLLTHDVLNQLLVLFTQAERKLRLKISVDNHQGMKNPTIALILKVSASFKRELKAVITMPPQSSSDSDDDFQNCPAHELNFFTHLRRPVSSKDERRRLYNMGPYEKYKLEIEEVVAGLYQ